MQRLKPPVVFRSETRNAEQRLVALELQRGALEGPRNLAWSAQGDATLQPSEVSDNGRFTVLRFPGGQAIPALFEVGEDGSERLIPYDVRGEFVVVHAAPRGLRLRRGRAVLWPLQRRLRSARLGVPYGDGLACGGALADRRSGMSPDPMPETDTPAPRSLSADRGRFSRPGAVRRTPRKARRHRRLALGLRRVPRRHLGSRRGARPGAPGDRRSPAPGHALRARPSRSANARG